jgi:hypothetical protein
MKEECEQNRCWCWETKLLKVVIKKANAMVGFFESDGGGGDVDQLQKLRKHL